MSRILVIDSLARSGTTLLTALINSQEKCAGLRAVFYEALACNVGSWPFGLIHLPILSEDYPINVVNNTKYDTGAKINYTKRSYWNWLSSIKIKLRHPITLDTGVLLNGTLDRIHSMSQTGLFSESEWEELLNKKINNLQELDQLYQDICEKACLSVLGFRWNQGIYYAPKWLRNPRHFWCTVVRNPMDRAASAHMTHEWSFRRSLSASIAYADNIKFMEQYPNFKVIYYEDLVEKPDYVLAKVFDWLGDPRQSFELEDLRGQHGRKYRSETADDVEKMGTHKVGREYGGIYNSALGRYEKVMSDRDIRTYKKVLSKYELYSRYFKL